MFRNFDDMIEKACTLQKKRKIVIAAAAEDKLLRVAKTLIEMKMCEIILVDDRMEIENLAEECGLDLNDVTVVDEKDDERKGLAAVALVSSGQADILVKGLMNTSDFLRAVLNREVGLRTGRKLSVMSCYDIPDLKKLLFMTDAGMMVAPNLEDKAAILQNAVPVLHNMGIIEPKVALLSSNEKVSKSIPSTVDAAALCERAEKGELPEGIYEGPIAFDVAMRPEAAEEKHIVSRVSGDVDLFLVPNIETGNCLGKAMGFFGHGQTAVMVVGASRPIVMPSRAASERSKIASIAWAILACAM